MKPPGFYRSYIRGRERHIVLVTSGGCALLICVYLLLRPPGPPHEPDNLCAIFEERHSWYRDAVAAKTRWGTPVALQMAIIRQESGFRGKARPARRTLLGFIPWSRPSTAYGYAQAMEGTWNWYIEKTGNRGADRDDFDDATDFIGWYTDMSERRLKIPKTDSYRQYLAYHEGHGGFQRRSYEQKSWLLAVARTVAEQSRTYAAQLDGCRAHLDTKRVWWPLF